MSLVMSPMSCIHEGLVYAIRKYASGTGGGAGCVNSIPPAGGGIWKSNPVP